VANFNLNDFRRECIDADKVYDWIINQQTETVTNVDDWDFIPIQGGGLNPCDAPVEIDNVDCRILLGEGTDTECEVIDVEDMEVTLPDGEEVDLQLVTLQKTIEVELTFDEGGQPFRATNTVTLPPEEVILCAPEGTEIDCRILDSSNCRAFNLRCTDGSPEDFVADLRLNICQSIQSFTNVKLEVLARFCQPREEIIAPTACPVPLFPEQCPEIFPNNVGSSRTTKGHNNLPMVRNEDTYE